MAVPSLATATTGSPVVLEAEFRSGMGSGEAVVHRKDGMLWVCAPDGTLAGSLSITTT